jgi:hypothetical protein
MRLSHFTLVLGAIGRVSAQFHPKKPATYPSLPSLREQAYIQDKWTAKRLDHVPELMKVYGVDAWLV